MPQITEPRRDEFNWNARGTVHKFEGRLADARARLFSLLEPDAKPVGLLVPDATADAGGNLLTTAGLNRVTSLIIAAGGQAPTNTSARIGVGSGTTTATVADTDLSAAAGAGNRQFEIMAATYPQQANGVMTFRAVFTTGEANFHWQEWGIDVGTPTVAAGTTVAALLLNHKVVDLGTKTSAAAWTFTVTITLS